MSQVTNFGIGIIPPGTLVETLTGNSGGAVGPDGSNNINVVGDGTTIDVAGDPGTNTLTISYIGSSSIDFDTDDGTATPAMGVLDVLGGHDINTQGAGSTLTINLNNAITLGDVTPIAPGSDA